MTRSTPADVYETLEDVSAAVEQWVSGLEPLAVPEPFRSALGSIADTDVRMTSRCYQHPLLERVTVARLFTVSGNHPLSVTVSALPRAQVPLPILGLDYVGFRGTLSLVALDLCPTHSGFWQEHAAHPMTQIREQADALKARKIPGFTRGVFSELAVFSAATTATACEQARQLSHHLLKAYQDLMALPLPSVPDQQEQLRRWKLAMQSNKKEHSALSRIFGERFTERYLKEFLFAVSDVSEQVS